MTLGTSLEPDKARNKAENARQAAAVVVTVAAEEIANDEGEYIVENNSDGDDINDYDYNLGANKEEVEEKEVRKRVINYSLENYREILGIKEAYNT